MRILAIHNILWSHYKARIFKGLQEIADAEKFDFYVIQLAYTEHSRAALGTDLGTHQYNYKVLFPDDVLENIKTLPKAQKLLAQVRAYRPTLVYLNGYYDPAYWLVLLYCRLKNIKIVLDFESTETSRKRVWWKESLKKYFLNNCDGIVCLGTKAAEYLRRLNIPENKILSTKNVGIDNDALFQLHQAALEERESNKKKFGLPTYNFIYAGRFVGRKNLLLLMKMFDSAQKKSSNKDRWGLILSGSGDEYQAMKELKQYLSNDSINFFEPCEWYEVPGRYALADVAVLPSTFEPFGFVTNEALVYGMPVIVSERCGSAADLVINGQNGFTFDPFNAADLEDKLIKIMGISERFKEFGEVGQRLIAEWHPDIIVNELMKAFKMVQKR